jgi:pyruvate-formate lyase
MDAALPPDELDRLIIRVAGYALRFFVGAPSDTPSLDAC